MKIAFCLYGTVGKKEAYRAGKLKSKHIDINIPARHYYKHIIQKNINCEFDVFCHTSSKGFHQQLVEIYNPKKIIVEKNPFLEDPLVVDNSKIREYGNKSRWYSTWKVNKLREEYEESQQKWYHINKFEYDFIFLTRYDIVFFDGFRFDELDPNIFYTQGTKYENVGPKWEQAGRILDWWFVASPKNMSKFCDAYENFDELVEQTVKLNLPAYDQHCIVYQQIKKHELNNKKLLYREDDHILCRYVERGFHERTQQNEWKLDKQTGLYTRK